MASDIQTVRTLIGDRKKSVVRELVVPSNDGKQLKFRLDMYPLVSGAGNGQGTGVVKIFSSGVEKSLTATMIISGSFGNFTLSSALTAGAKLEANYTYYALTSGELSDILSGLTGSPYLAAANACLILAADASRFYAYTMGEKTVDKRRIASDLRELSKELEKRHYNMSDKNGYTAAIVTMRDDTGTPYYNYDTAVAYLGNSGVC